MTTIGGHPPPLLLLLLQGGQRCMQARRVRSWILAWHAVGARATSKGRCTSRPRPPPLRAADSRSEWCRIEEEEEEEEESGPAG